MSSELNPSTDLTPEATKGEAEARLRIRNRAGMHARPASEFVKVAARFSCEVWVRRDAIEVDGKSILGVMMLAAEQGAELVVRARGPEAQAAVEALSDLVNRGFGEDAPPHPSHTGAHHAEDL